ncbi:MAG: hypothetical protein V4722_15035 [Bacteroidota bacterium]
MNTQEWPVSHPHKRSLEKQAGKQSTNFYQQALLLYVSHLHAKKLEQSTVWDLQRATYSVRLGSSPARPKKPILLKKVPEPSGPKKRTGFTNHIALIQSYLGGTEGQKKTKPYEPKSRLPVLAYQRWFAI